jgi:hypothetical protein
LHQFKLTKSGFSVSKRTADINLLRETQVSMVFLFNFKQCQGKDTFPWKVNKDKNEEFPFHSSRELLE